MTRLVRVLFPLLCALVLSLSSARADTSIAVGTVPTIGDGSLICAIERGYFKEQGITIELQSFRNAQDMIPLLLRGDLKIIGGSMNVSYFNAVAKGLPIVYVVNRSQSPVHHNLMIRGDLKDAITVPKDLKGRSIGITGAGSTVDYEVAQVLAAGGLTLDDVDVKDLGMSEMAVAFRNHAIDAGILISPFIETAETQGAVRWVDPQDFIPHPMEISGMTVNKNWAAENAGVLDRFVIAFIKGSRCHYEAANGGANRAELIDMLVKYTAIKDRAVYEKMQWTSTNPDGLIDKDGVLALQRYFIERGYLKAALPIERLIDEQYVERALKVIGPYQH